ncbi:MULTISPECIES: succinyl-diaminopimelate desuccinylase [unclassified Allobranchiibius]|uniref:succinyl-diaminopimelate desuccinylase n=1 Tax=unclassified Allobranchiibius TaxID=2649857 RepID=UPI001AA0FE81|nr:MULTISPECIES: succinyl-diaminopimelate desuccinylase [unclassified Allobranchiibius]MBO1765857.1 succinyl-diaminopimelate desuccinylase [Allobranchiibius sp. GilTou38]UIJ34755.1 succinyl-diaminopimelate desuccinylase [Allobranchiibius sp. GilTou73]
MPIHTLDLTRDVVTLTADLCDIASVSTQERAIADAVEAALLSLPHLDVVRDGNVVVARTELGRDERVVLAGHLDTVPLTDPPNIPVRRVDGMLVGRGTTDMKGGVAVQLALAARVPDPSRDVTFIFYDCEEIEEEFNGLKRIGEQQPDLLDAEFAVLLEPTNGGIEGGCKGTLRVDVVTKGTSAHSARPWNGHNAIHDAGDVLARLTAYEPATVQVDGLDYHEALNAVGISGGIAGNVIPDVCTVSVNYRFAPDKSAEEALAHVQQVFSGYDVTLGDCAIGARPGLDQPAAQAFVDALGLPVVAKEGWTDVARFAALDIPAVNFGPGDPNLAHTDDERCPEQQIEDALAALTRWLA